jgi:YHS domain-containing protein
MAIFASRTATDPVCGTVVRVARAAGAAYYRGQELFFCSSHCGTTFAADPDRYVTAPAAPPLRT